MTQVISNEVRSGSAIETILSKYAKKSENAFFTVKRERLFRKDGADTGHDVLFRKDTGEQLSVMSKQYGLVTHREAVDFAVGLLANSGVDTSGIASQSIVSSKGSKLFHKIAFPAYTFDAAEATGVRNTAFDGKPGSDKITPIITVRNSYDGTSPITFDGGCMRLVCENGMKVRNSLYVVKLRHGKNVDLNHAAPDFVEQIAYIVDGVKRDYSRLNQESAKFYLQDLFLQQELAISYLREIERALSNQIVVDWVRHEAGTKAVPGDLVLKSDFSAWALFCVITQIASHKAKGELVSNRIHDYAARKFLNK